MMTKIVWVGICSLLCGESIAQHAPLWENMSQKYPGEAAVFLSSSETMNIIVSGDSLNVRSNISEDILYLKGQAELTGSRKIYGSSFVEAQNIEAKTLVLDKNKYREFPVSSFRKNSSPYAGTFFDDSYYYSFDFPMVMAGNRTQLQYTHRYKEPRFISAFTFANYLPAEKISYIIKAPEEVELAYAVLNDPDHSIRFTKTRKGNMVTYQWIAENLPALKHEERSPPINYFVPQVVCYIRSFQGSGGKTRILSDLTDLYKWYRPFINDINRESSSELQSIVTEIKLNSKSELDLVRNVFYWVQENIQYIAFEEGMRGHIPHSGSYVCEKRYGDCKDMANLIVNMLQLAGVTAYHTWIGSRDIPYKYSELPTPMVDNHMIATYISPDNQYYFLDATGQYIPFGYPTPMIQGKEALIAKTPTEFEIKEVPVTDKQLNVMIDTTRLTFRDRSIVGKGQTTMTGFPKVFAAYKLNRVDQNDVRKEVISMVGKGSNKFFLESYALSGVADRASPTNIKYEFRISDYHQALGNELYINLNLSKDYYNDFINTATRKAPIENEYNYVETQYVELEIPDGYGVEYLPSDISHSTPYFSCSITYERKGNKVVCIKKISVNYLLLQSPDFEKWNQSIKIVSEAYRESIILKTK